MIFCGVDVYFTSGPWKSLRPKKGGGALKIFHAENFLHHLHLQLFVNGPKVGISVDLIIC